MYGWDGTERCKTASTEGPQSESLRADEHLFFRGVRVDGVFGVKLFR